MRVVDGGAGLELSDLDLETLQQIYETCSNEEYFSSRTLRVLGRILNWLEDGVDVSDEQPRGVPHAATPTRRDALLGQPPVTAGTYGGITRSTVPAYRDYVFATTGPLTFEYPANSIRIEGIADGGEPDGSD